VTFSPQTVGSDFMRSHTYEINLHTSILTLKMDLKPRLLKHSRIKMWQWNLRPCWCDHYSVMSLHV